MSNTPRQPEWRTSLTDASRRLYELHGRTLATLTCQHAEPGQVAPWRAEIPATGVGVIKATQGEAEAWVEAYIEALGVNRPSEDYIIVEGICPIKHTPWVLKIRREDYDAWKAGTPIQEALPALSADQRELLLSGLTAAGFNTVFGTKE